MCMLANSVQVQRPTHNQILVLYQVSATPYLECIAAARMFTKPQKIAAIGVLVDTAMCCQARDNFTVFR